MSIVGKILLGERALVETADGGLKGIAQVEHSRCRPFSSFIANTLPVIAAYCFLEKEPAINVKFVNNGKFAIP